MIVAFVIGLLATAGWIVMAVANADVMPSYLAAWLFWLAVPVGALPIVMTLDLVGAPGGVLATVLRRALLLLPVGAVFAIPVLLRTAPLFRREGLADALPAAWMAPGAFIGRACVILVVLSALALLFSRAPARGSRPGLAAVGLLLHVSLVSVAAVDWVMSLQPGLGSSAIGLLLVLSQVGIAGCLAAFVVAVGTRRDSSVPGVGVWLAVLLAGWCFLHFVQFLVVWSANLPREVTWYLDRLPGGGAASIWFLVAASAIGLAVLPSSLARIPAVLASLAAMLLLAHLVETLWLVTPAFRGGFVVTPADGLAVLGIGGLLVGLLLALLPRGTEVGHARA